MVATTELTRVVCPCSMCQESRRRERMEDALDYLAEVADRATEAVALLGVLTPVHQEELSEAWRGYVSNLNYKPPVFASLEPPVVSWKEEPLVVWTKGLAPLSEAFFSKPVYPYPKPQGTISSAIEPPATTTAEEVIAKSNEYYSSVKESVLADYNTVLDEMILKLLALPIPTLPGISVSSPVRSLPYLTVTQPSKSATRGAILFSRFTKELAEVMQGLQLPKHSQPGASWENIKVMQSRVCGQELTQAEVKLSPSKQFFELSGFMDGGTISLKISTYSYPWTPNDLKDHPHFHQITVKPVAPYHPTSSPYGLWTSSVFGLLRAGESKIFCLPSVSASSSVRAEAERASSPLTWLAQSYAASSGGVSSQGNAESFT